MQQVHPFAFSYKKKSQLLALLCLLLIGVIFQRGLQLGLVESVGPRMQYHAIPVAISVLYHGHPHDYTALRGVAIPFQGPAPVKEYVREAIDKKVEQRDTYYWVADDRGSADFVILAFKAFGPKTFSMYLLWFVCLLFTTTLFLASFRNRLWCLALLGLVLIGIYTAVSTLPLADEATFLSVQSVGGGPLSAVGIYETRFLDVLAMIPVVHICLFAMQRSWVSSDWQIAALIGQVCFFFFLYHARSSLGWQIVAIVGFLSLVVVYRIWRGRKKENKKFDRFTNPVVVIAALVIGLGALSIYKHATYNSRYFLDMGARTFWHNILMGIHEREVSDRYQLTGVGDLEVATAVIKYAQQSGCENQVIKLDPQGLLNSLGGHGEQDWFSYEKCARKLYTHLWKNHTRSMVHNYLVIKPQQTLSTLLNVSRSAHANFSETIRHQLSVGWHPLTGTPFIFALVILLVARKDLYRRLGSLFALLAVVLVASLIPSIVFYSVILTLGGFFVALASLVYLFIALGICVLLTSVIFLYRFITPAQQIRKD